MTAEIIAGLVFAVISILFAYLSTSFSKEYKGMQILFLGNSFLFIILDVFIIQYVANTHNQTALASLLTDGMYVLIVCFLLFISYVIIMFMYDTLGGIKWKKYRR